ncbi:HNH endonuclease [Corynebacterium diphtheriae]|nr:hypothetical protein E4653_14005 [Corynebacterium diphtheriae subsp. lausannense]SPJ40184.1 HNH endonuclease [Corynebacterium diphtheriae] [Corynebacterium diphtheriae subsp. lausannense]
MSKHTHCKGCGAELDQSNCRNPKVWCSEACRVRWYRNNVHGVKERNALLAKERNAKLEEAKPPRPRCLSCGAEMPRRKNARYCTKPECRSMGAKEHRLRQRPCSVIGCDRPVQAKGLCGSHYASEWSKKNVDRRNAMRGRYKARKREAFVEDVVPSEVFERDHWVCGICGERIPKRAKWPDVRSASVDHIVPLAAGGMHEMKNVQAAHLGCNSAKRHKGSGDQLALI